VGVSTDKACKPVNVMGMTKALQERIFISANIRNPETRFICVRYGNVLASRGSVIPHFHDQIRAGGPLTITTAEMTRFLLPLSRAVDTIFFALDHADPGETIVPRVPAARITDLAKVLIAGRDIPIKVTGIRPGEKVHEIMVSDEEAWRTVPKGSYYAIKSMLPELMKSIEGANNPLRKEYSSGDDLMSVDELSAYLADYNLLNSTQDEFDGELLR
jgi:UDP-glucose 4-epimerase